MAIPYAAMFVAAGKRYGVDPAFIAAVAKQESGFNPNALSPAGAIGLMQLLPNVAASLGVDPRIPLQAIDGAARLLAKNLKQFGSFSSAAAAYNAGPGAVMQYGGVPPYAETQNYVRKVLAYRDDFEGTLGSAAAGTSWTTIALGVFALGAVGSAIFYMQKGRLPFMRRMRA